MIQKDLDSDVLLDANFMARLGDLGEEAADRKGRMGLR